MAFCMGVLNENQGHASQVIDYSRKLIFFIQAVKFFKRFFFCARMLDDPVGASLALNRIGVSYYKKKKYDKSLKFHVKHNEFTD